MDRLQRCRLIRDLFYSQKLKIPKTSWSSYAILLGATQWLSAGMSSCDALHEILNSDDKRYWGSGAINDKDILVTTEPKHFRLNSFELNIPPLGVSVLRPVYGEVKITTESSI